MGNDELSTLDYFLCLPNHDLRHFDTIFGPRSPNGANAPNTPKQVKLEFRWLLDLSKASVDGK